jgi:hypothetical protein
MLGATIEEVIISLHTFLTSALDAGERLALRLCPKKPAISIFLGGWVGLRVGLDDVEKRKKS